MEAFLQWLAQLRWDSAIELLVTLAACVLCITFHETCHGLAALAMGDPTAKRAGRLSLNPLKHVDVMGLIMMAVARFGWAKPVPIDPRYFKNPKLGMALTALAGPLGNVVLCVIAALGYSGSVYLMIQTGNPVFDWIYLFFYMVFYLSAGLAVFNLLPVPPLDGSKILFALLPPKWYWKLMRYERYGMIALAVLLLTGLLDGPLSLLREGLVGLISPVSLWFYELLANLTF